MKLVQGMGAGSLVSSKSAEAEETWLKRIAQAVADLGWRGDRGRCGQSCGPERVLLEAQEILMDIRET